MSGIGWVIVVSVVALILAGGALWVALGNRRAMRARGITAPTPDGDPVPRNAAAADSRPLVAFVANPTKPGVPALRDTVVQACAARYLPEPLWLETTAEDPGVGQAREAVAQGATVVVAVGGDGTVRAVAEGLIGTDATMALLPQGTGNLLARNLDLPLGDLDELLRIALSGPERPIDVGWLTVVRDESDVTDDVAEADPAAVAPEETPRDAPVPARDHIFLVISGLGFDAAMVADADEELKARVGWIAYFVAGVKHLHARRLRLQMSLDESPWFNVRLRSVLIGNCGKLPAGVVLLPDAEIDDGWLDVAAIDTRVGLLGWTQLFGEVTLQRFGVRTKLPNKAGRIDHARVREMRVRMREPQHVQVDGDIIGRAYEIAARVDEHALRVRVAEDAPA